MSTHHHHIRGVARYLQKNLLLDGRRLDDHVMEGDANRMLGGEKPREFRERPIAVDRFETERPRSFGAVRHRRNGTGHRQDVQNGEIGAEAARERHRTIEGVARELGEIDRTENVLDVDHDYLQSCCGAEPR